MQMKQETLTDGFEKYRQRTRKEQFLADMEQIIPWEGLVGVIEPFYPKPKGAGRRPIGIDRMLRIYFLQHGFNLSDPAAEEALYDSRAMRQFIGVDRGREPAPDETTLCKFRHLMERHNLAEHLFIHVNDYLRENGLKVNRGTIVDATIIEAPSSTKNKDKQRDPDMHQTKKGNQWHFGMKMHIGVDSRSKLIHHVTTSAANVHDGTQIGELLHGDETRVWGDAAYTGKSRVRVKVEHVFGVMKGMFGFRKVRYKGLEKNTHHVFAVSSLVNLVLAKKVWLRRTNGQRRECYA